MNQLTNAQISFSPTFNQLSEIESWLKEEQLKYRTGFFGNWSVIKLKFDQKTMAIISINDNPIGFAIWQPNGYTVTLEIAEIKRSYRKKGYGRLLFDGLSKHFLSTGFLTIKLECKPPSSEPIWKKMGFVNFPEIDAFKRFNESNNVSLYKILIPFSEPFKKETSGSIIELWSNQPTFTKNEKPAWLWQLEMKDPNQTLTNPIIWPCQEDWRIRWRENELIIKDDRVKCFGKNFVVCGDFLIIKAMP